MKRFFIIIILFLVLFNLGSEEIQQSEKYIEKVKVLNENATSGRQILVLIAINKYVNRLPLKNRVENAEKIKKTIVTKYYIDKVVELYDFYASKNNIEKLFKKLQTDLKKNDSVIIYYSGHGYLETSTNKAYWIPSDAGINEDLKENWISASDISKYMSKISVNHACLIVDSCFSSNVLDIKDYNKIRNNIEYFKNAYKGRSRVVLASGITQTGSDISEFSKYVRDELKKNNDSYFDPYMIFDKIETKMSDSVPLLGQIKGSGYRKESSFVFFLREKDPVRYEEAVEKTKVKVVKRDRAGKDVTKIAVKEMTEKEIKKTYFNKVLFSPKKLNRASVILLPIGSTITLAALGFFIFDVVAVFPRVKELSQGTYYEDYRNAYEMNVAMFANSIVWSVIGLGMMGVSLSLRLYALKKRRMSLNINVNDNIELSLSYKLNMLKKSNMGL